MATHEAQSLPSKSASGKPPGRTIELGDLATSSSDFRSAVDHYRRALDEPASSAGERRVATLRKLSECLLHLGETVEAQAVIQDAAHAIDESTTTTERARVELQIGRLAARSRDLDEARQHADRAVEILEEGPPCAELGRAYHQQGANAYRLGDVELAMRKYQTALKVYKEIGDLVLVARAYRDIGFLHKDACNWSRALENYQVAYNLMATEGNYADLPLVMQSLGVVHFKIGNIGESLDYFDRALKASREIGDPLASARALLGQAQVRQQQRQFSTAADLYRNALEICLLGRYLYGTALAYFGIAEVALATGDVPSARRACEKAADVVSRMGKQSNPRAELQILDARIALAEGDPARALTSAEEGLEGARRTADRIQEARALHVLSEIRLASSDVAAAEQLLGSGAELLRRVGERYHLARALELLGRINLRSDSDRIVLKGQQHLLEAGDCYRALDLPEPEARVLLAIAREDLRQRAIDRAIDRVDTARRLRDRVENGRELEREIAEIYRLIEQSFVSNAASAREGFDAHRQMEDVLKSDRPVDEKIARFLKVLSGAIPCDGTAVLSLGRDDDGFRVVGCHGVEGLPVGKRQRLPSGLRVQGWPDNQRPLVFLGVSDPDRAASLGVLARGRRVGSAVAIPLGQVREEWTVLYVDRVTTEVGSYFHQAEISYCMTLARQLAAFLEEANIKNRRGLRELPNIERNLALADIVTESAEMQGILGLVSRVARSNLTVLLQGETGTGKKLIARAIHECSPRAGNPFVTVDCAALPESILESELFGYIKGAFTGATSDRPGILEQADSGTVFLDEIDKAGIQVQRRFLHLLDCGEIRAVGGRAYRTLDIRVVCATSASSLRAEVENGRFIKDLYFRLNDVSITVPPLRDRKEDVSLLAEYFMDVFAQEMKKNIAGISQMAMKKLLDYEWPGNVRELEKVVRRAVTLADDGETVGIDLLPSRVIEDVHGSIEVPAGGGGSLKDQLEAIEKQLVKKALEEHDGNKSRAAAALGLSRKGLKNKISRFGLERRSSRG